MYICTISQNTQVKEALIDPWIPPIAVHFLQFEPDPFARPNWHIWIASILTLHLEASVVQIMFDLLSVNVNKNIMINLS